MSYYLFHDVFSSGQSNRSHAKVPHGRLLNVWLKVCSAIRATYLRSGHWVDSYSKGIVKLTIQIAHTTTNMNCI